jgi:hypothetical protein
MMINHPQSIALQSLSSSIVVSMLFLFQIDVLTIYIALRGSMARDIAIFDRRPCCRRDGLYYGLERITSLLRYSPRCLVS